MLFAILFTVTIVASTYLFWKLDCNPLLAFYVKFFPNTEKLRNKTVWIIGSSSGIGESLAYEFAALNCRLILTSTTISKLNAVKVNFFFDI